MCFDYNSLILPTLWTLYQWLSFSMCFFCVWLKILFVSFNRVICKLLCSFPLFYSSPSYKYVTLYPFYCWWILVCSLGLVQEVLVYFSTFLHMVLILVWAFLLSRYLEVESQTHRTWESSALVTNAKHFSKEVVPIHTPTSNLRIPVPPHTCHSFWYYSV